ncbi:MAG: nitroreductase family protein [Candidatus Omnitrophica bacterium]|nr:nitroreductase family protein [Candidatus Omnitrophota bacterium]MDD5501016.1 nitroreductase family protein [Candidatus Omnitrophota bacterium]
MQGLDLLRTRRSIRSFCLRAVERRLLEDIVDSARFAPTARNVQPWEFVVVTDRPALCELAGMADNGRFLEQAPACIAVFCLDTKYYLEDGCAATCNILLSATDSGLGSCWIAGDKKPYSSRVCSFLKAPAGMKLVSLVALGYPAGVEAGAPQKRPLKDILHWGSF